MIMFHHLNTMEIEQIVRLQLTQLQRLLEKNDIGIQISDEAIRFIAAEGFDPLYGARPLKRVIQREVLNKLSKMILAGVVLKDKQITIGFNGAQLVFSN